MPTFKTNWVATDTPEQMSEVLNRIESNTIYVATELRSRNYQVPTMIHKTNWVDTDIIYDEDLNRIEENIKKVCDSFKKTDVFIALKTDWETLDPVDFNMLNRLEVDLKMTHELIVIIGNMFSRCGVFKPNQEFIYQQRFRRIRTKITWADINNINIILGLYCKGTGNIPAELDNNSNVADTLTYINNKYTALDNLVGGGN